MQNFLICDILSPPVDADSESENPLNMKHMEKEKEKEENSSDDEGGLEQSLTARRFNRSMKNVVKISKSYRSQVTLRGVIKAKNRFLKLIDRAPEKIEPSEKDVKEIETPICVVESEWKKLSMRPPKFKISRDIDFSDLAKYIVQREAGPKLARLSLEGETLATNSAHGAPPPPPPPMATPPPPSAPSTSPNLVGGPQRGRKIKPIHVKKVHVKTNQETVWSTLPVFKAEFGDLRKLFEDTSSSNAPDPRASDHQDLQRSTSIMGPLSVTEATDILIMFRKLPKYVLSM